MTSTSNVSAICINRLITTVHRVIAESGIKTALPVAPAGVLPSTPADRDL
jgi:hypothetical protein